MRVLVTFAVETEFAPWRRRHKFELLKKEPRSFYQAKIGDLDVGVLLTGIGEGSSAAVMGEMMSDDLAFCISSGLAGALRQEHRVGDVLVPRELRFNQLHTDLDGDLVPCDPDLARLAAGCGAKRVQEFLTVDRILVTASEKSALGGAADAADMESFAVVKEAYAWGVRPVVVRAISDVADEDLPLDFNRTLSQKGDVRVSKVLSELRRKPQALPALVRFAQQSRRAADSLADFLDKYIPALSSFPTQSNVEEVAAT
jgi:adenosylhomocysteine nucleosidase